MLELSAKNQDWPNFFIIRIANSNLRIKPKRVCFYAFYHTFKIIECILFLCEALALLCTVMTPTASSDYQGQTDKILSIQAFKIV